MEAGEPSEKARSREESLISKSYVITCRVNRVSRKTPKVVAVYWVNRQSPDSPERLLGSVFVKFALLLHQRRSPCSACEATQIFENGTLLFGAATGRLG